MKQKRILIITPEYTLGGAEAQLRYIILAIAEKGLLADVFVLNSVKKGKDELLEQDRRKLQGISFYELGVCGASEYKEREVVRDFVCQNNARNYKVVLIFHEKYTPLIPFFKEMGIATVYSERLEAKRICEEEIFRPFVKECDVLTANSEIAARRMEETFERSVQVIRNGKEPIKRLPYNRPLKIQKILVPCRIVPLKNQMLVLLMAKHHAERQWDIRLVGENQCEGYEKKLRDFVFHENLGSSVVFADYKLDMKKEYEWADVVVLPSLSEGIPNVVLESFQYGRPVIVSDIPAERGIIADNRLRFSPTDYEGIFSSIKYIEQLDASSLNEMLDCNSRYVSEMYGLSRMTDSFIRILKKMLERKTAPVPAAGYHACKSDLHAVIREYEKKEQFYSLLCRWNRLLQDDEGIIRFFRVKGYYKIAIYGFKELGELLYHELSGTDIQVVCIIDREASSIVAESTVIMRPDDEPLEDVDAIIVTAVSHMKTIKQQISQIWTCPIISLEEVIASGM